MATDRFSRMSLDALRAMGKADEIEAADLPDKYCAVAYRWLRRGLSAADAVRKAERDLDSAARFADRGHRDELDKDEAWDPMPR